MCDAECQAEFVAKSKEEAAELENIVLLVTFFLLVCLVYITGLIVWVWCNRNPDEGLNAVQQTDRVALKSGTRSSSMVMAGHSSSHTGRHNGHSGLDGGILLLLGALIGQQCQERLNCHRNHQINTLQQNSVNTNSLHPTHSTSANSLDPNYATANSAVQNSTTVNSTVANTAVANSAVPLISTIANPISTISIADQDPKLSISANSISHKVASTSHSNGTNCAIQLATSEDIDDENDPEEVIIHSIS
jgi:hypothetical protein